jgi:hypothetical protein
MSCSCNKTPCCCVKTISKLGKSGKKGDKGGPGLQGPPGPAFVPAHLTVGRVTLQLLNNAAPEIDDADCQFVAVPAGTYLLMFEANCTATRDTSNAEDVYFNIFVNGTLFRRTHTMNNYQGTTAEVKAVTTCVLVLAVPTNVKINYSLSSTLVGITPFVANPTQAMAIQEGALTLLKIG